MRSAPPRRALAGVILIPFIWLALAPTAAGAVPADAAGGKPEAARIEGTLAVTVIGTRVKHWGVPSAEAVFVPRADPSVYADRIRRASTARSLCAAVMAANRHDDLIEIAPIDGDGNLEHRSGDEERMTFAMSIPARAQGTRGTLYVCAQPFSAMMSNGAYPRESFYQLTAGHTLYVQGDELIVHPGQSLPVRLSADVDASGW